MFKYTSAYSVTDISCRLAKCMHCKTEADSFRLFYSISNELNFELAFIQLRKIVNIAVDC